MFRFRWEVSPFRSRTWSAFKAIPAAALRGFYRATSLRSMPRLLRSYEQPAPFPSGGPTWTSSPWDRLLKTLHSVRAETRGIRTGRPEAQAADLRLWLLRMRHWPRLALTPEGLFDNLPPSAAAWVLSRLTGGYLDMGWWRLLRLWTRSDLSQRTSGTRL